MAMAADSTSVSSDYLVLIISFLIPYGSLKNPLKNWDIIGYTAVILSSQHSNATSLHKATWDTLDQSLGDTLNLRQGSDYAKAVATSPEALSQQLPFYQPRIGYTFLAALITKITSLDIPKATIFISSVAISILFITIYFTLTKTYPPASALFITFAMAVCLHWFVIARASSPDSLGTLAAFLAFVFLRSGKIWLFTIFCTLLLTIRHDQIIPILLMVFAYPKNNLHKKIAHACFFIIVFVGIYYSSQWYGWNLLFMHTFAAPYPYPKQITLDTQEVIKQYVAQWKSIWFLISNDFQSSIPIAIAAMGIAARRRARPDERRLVDALIFSMFTKLLMFPTVSGHWSRLFMAEITCLLIIVITLNYRENVQKSVY